MEHRDSCISLPLHTHMYTSVSSKLHKTCADLDFTKAVRFKWSRHHYHRLDGTETITRKCEPSRPHRKWAIFQIPEVVIFGLLASSRLGSLLTCRAARRFDVPCHCCHNCTDPANTVRARKWQLAPTPRKRYDNTAS